MLTLVRRNPLPNFGGFKMFDFLKSHPIQCFYFIQHVCELTPEWYLSPNQRVKNDSFCSRVEHKSQLSRKWADSMFQSLLCLLTSGVAYLTLSCSLIINGCGVLRANFIIATLDVFQSRILEVKWCPATEYGPKWFSWQGEWVGFYIFHHVWYFKLYPVELCCDNEVYLIMREQCSKIWICVI